ncbi:parasitic phase-specific protein PSP-1 [Podospora appendiculata]|uniref:Parasitic phase-specific protein PSP-1 n=1 Tax=Podospora appendiculata TaxID=314037 RepID=A0AAE0X1W8_9PEZI|nr:parasitic phase-specific protein PSP-1 [Podospora appendiculata]
MSTEGPPLNEFGLPDGLIPFGGLSNCTLALCPLETSVFQYQPSIPAQAIIIVLFALSMLVHIWQGFRYKSWSFMICIVIGCVDECIGYGGRIIMHDNPFNFQAFLMQIICITTAPVFFCSSIYVLLSRTINYLDPSLSRFNPKWFILTFIPSDILSLIFQATGGALSSVLTGDGQRKIGVNISIAGLVLQVFTLVIFVGLFMDYVIRYHRKSGVASKIQVFLGFLFASILFILIRSIFRIDELIDGYNGPLMHNQGLFIALESVMVLIAVFCLHIAHPGLAFGKDGYRVTSANVNDSGSYLETADQDKVHQEKVHSTSGASA